ncbi:MAG: pyrroline-5-carboxylate reductase [Wenzhouxiangellaceae bacterium]|nr:pyrroline-5-carboxylate reductase [Wenzhouxiangellaceae bacterium]
MDATIAMIGAGNMAQALIGGLLETGHDPSRLRASDPDPDCRRHVAERYRIAMHEDNAAAATGADIIVLAVKPQVIDRVLEPIAAKLAADAVVVSIAAGIPLARLQRWLPAAQALARVMPNTPALVGAGASGLYCSAHCSTAQRATVAALFESVGRVVEINDEALMDAITAVSGSGPAYFFALTEALADAGVRAGLERADAEQLAAQTALGAGRMLTESGTDAGELRRRVTSPGGTTAAALAVFENGGLKKLVEHAVQAAVARGRALGVDDASGNKGS